MPVSGKMFPRQITSRSARIRQDAPQLHANVSVMYDGNNSFGANILIIVFCFKKDHSEQRKMEVKEYCFEASILSNTTSTVSIYS